MQFDIRTINAIRAALVKNHQTVSVAESVSSGFLQAALSQAKEASTIFQGGITAYNLGQKSRHLLIEPVAAEMCNCVSQTVANQMALKVTEKFSSNFGLAVTGYASLQPEAGIDSLYAFGSVSLNGKVIAHKKLIPPGNPDNIEAQLFYTNAILKMFNSALKKANHEGRSRR